MVNRFTCLLACVCLLSGCAQLRSIGLGPEKVYEPVVVARSMHADFILTCLQDTRGLPADEFADQFALAGADLEGGTEFDKLHFVCLSLNEQAHYPQFLEGKKIFGQLLAEQADRGKVNQGLEVLIERLDKEINTRWSSWKTLIAETKELRAENAALRLSLEAARSNNEELLEKIEQLKDIEEIMKRRETNRP